MTTGIPMLDIALVAAVFAWLLYWMYSLTSRSHAKRAEMRHARAHARQAWDPNTYEGRRHRD